MKLSGWSGAILLVSSLAAGSLASAQEIKYPDGMLIQKVIAGTPADKAGLQSGDLVLKVDGRLITNQEDFAAIINSSGGQVVMVVKKGTGGKICRVGLDL